jgi:hypothetical protein
MFFIVDTFNRCVLSAHRLEARAEERLKQNEHRFARANINACFRQTIVEAENEDKIIFTYGGYDTWNTYYIED